jgi:hypothetical protein
MAVPLTSLRASTSVIPSSSCPQSAVCNTILPCELPLSCSPDLTAQQLLLELGGYSHPGKGAEAVQAAGFLTPKQSAAAKISDLSTPNTAQGWTGLNRAGQGRTGLDRAAYHYVWLSHYISTARPEAGPASNAGDGHSYFIACDRGLSHYLVRT